MPLICTHCQRMNSADARYCYHDGASLLGTAYPAPLATQTFPAPFVFPSGHACRDFDQFALGCQSHWDAAAEMLRKGFIQQFFSGLGRMDLGHFAQEAASFPDRDRGLDQFLARLPSKSVPAARLDVQPKLINLGALKPGTNSTFELRLENKGARLIFGSLSSDCDWLSVNDAGAMKLFQFRDRAVIVIQVKGQDLRSGLKQLEGDVFVESNAGTFKLKVVVSVPIQAFPHGCLAGARTPRELAEKAKQHSKEAGVLFESGAVADWYRANGWTYPVQGPASHGMAAVQQFFEALGLSKPPKVFVTEPKLTLKGTPGTKVTKHIQVRSDEARPVFAYATSNVGWCVVKPAVMQGNLATLPIEIVVPKQVGEIAHTSIRVISNGQQWFDVPVQVIAEKSAIAPAAASSDVRAAPKATTPAFDPVNLAKHLAPLVVLGFVLLILIVKDVFSGAPPPALSDAIDDSALKHAKEAFKVDIQDEPDEGVNLGGGRRFKIEDEPEERFGPALNTPVKVEIKDEPEEDAPKNKGGAKAISIDPTPRITYQYDGAKRWGLIDAATRKRLTYAANGSTNTTIVRVAGQSFNFGGFSDFRKLPDDADGEGRMGTSYSYLPRPGLRVTQILQVVPSKQPVDVGGGKQRRLLDTLLVRYLFENTSKKAAINAGLRLEVDTLIGNNDGVPFTVPGRGLVNTSADFTRAESVPDFVQALETGDLRNPGTIVHISLKVGGGMEAPARATLCHWNTNGDLSNIRATNMGSDSAIIMVWPDKDLPPGQRREMGYAYGLGTVTVADPGGSLAVTLGGSFDIGQSFTITAYVNKPAAGQTLTLDMPAGLERVKGEQTQNVAPPTVGTTSIVSWEAKVRETGVFPVKVRSSTGITQTKTITIARGDAPIGGKLSLDLQGPFEPGQVFTVIGKVAEPVANQTLTLHLPAGLEKASGADTQAVPASQAGSTDALVQWQVRVTAPGRFPVRVSSSTGVAQTKTITIAPSARAEGAFQMLLTGDFSPGRTFTVSTKVVNPVLNQKLTLVLPAGLQRVDGPETQIPQPDATLSWKVKIDHAGRFSVGVQSTTGITQRKMLVIEADDRPGRFDFKLVGDIRPAREFQIIAEVSKPAAGQTLSLVLPAGLLLTKGSPEQPVPADASATVSWQVRVIDNGRLPIRIESSTGLIRTKTVTISKGGVF